MSVVSLFAVAINDVRYDVLNASTTIAIVMWNRIVGVASVAGLKWNAPVVEVVHC